MENKNDKTSAGIPIGKIDSVNGTGLNGDEVNADQETSTEPTATGIKAGEQTATDYSLGGVDNPILRAALRLAANGKRVFPQDLSVNDATTDGAVIRGWWTEYPDANVMIRTGQESGIFVLVVEGMSGGRSLNGLESEHGYLHTHRVMTPAGGRDLYFKHPGKEIKTMRNVLRGISITGDGGCIIAPPSIVRGWRYYWHAMKATKVAIPPTPDWLLDIIFREMKRRTRPRRPLGRRSIPAHQVQAEASKAAANSANRDLGDVAGGSN